MKISLVVFALCATAVYAGRWTELQIQEFSSQCIAEEGLDAASFNYENTVKPPVPSKKICYIACMHKKMGYMKPDGTYDEEKIIDPQGTPEMRTAQKKDLDEALKSCAAEGADNHCKLAACFHRLPKSQWA